MQLHVVEGLTTSMFSIIHNVMHLFDYAVLIFTYVADYMQRMQMGYGDVLKGVN